MVKASRFSSGLRNTHTIVGGLRDKQAQPSKVVKTFAARLGHAIRSHRHTAGLSQEEVGFSSELHPNYVGMVERGERNVSVQALVRLGQAIGVRASVILTEVDEVDVLGRFGEHDTEAV